LGAGADLPPGDGKLWAMEVDLRRLDGVVDESTLLHTWMNAESGEVIFQLGILAHPPQGQATRPERLIRLNSVSRIAAWLGSWNESTTQRRTVSRDLAIPR
jgi:hypothetical protein